MKSSDEDEEGVTPMTLSSDGFYVEEYDEFEKEDSPSALEVLDTKCYSPQMNPNEEDGSEKEENATNYEFEEDIDEEMTELPTPPDVPNFSVHTRSSPPIMTIRLSSSRTQQ